MTKKHDPILLFAHASISSAALSDRSELSKAAPKLEKIFSSVGGDFSNAWDLLINGSLLEQIAFFERMSNGLDVQQRVELGINLIYEDTPVEIMGEELFHYYRRRVNVFLDVLDTTFDLDRLIETYQSVYGILTQACTGSIESMVTSQKFQNASVGLIDTGLVAGIGFTTDKISDLVRTGVNFLQDLAVTDKPEDWLNTYSIKITAAAFCQELGNVEVAKKYIDETAPLLTAIMPELAQSRRTPDAVKRLGILCGVLELLDEIHPGVDDYLPDYAPDFRGMLVKDAEVVADMLAINLNADTGDKFFFAKSQAIKTQQPAPGSPLGKRRAMSAKVG